MMTGAQQSKRIFSTSHRPTLKLEEKSQAVHEADDSMSREVHSAAAQAVRSALKMEESIVGFSAAAQQYCAILLQKGHPYAFVEYVRITLSRESGKRGAWSKQRLCMRAKAIVRDIEHALLRAIESPLAVRIRKGKVHFTIRVQNERASGVLSFRRSDDGKLWFDESAIHALPPRSAVQKPRRSSKYAHRPRVLY